MKTPSVTLSSILFLSLLSVAGPCSGELVERRADVCVVGGGSGGYSAALAAARAGADCLLVEKLDVLGGTSTAGYVCAWQAGPADDFAREIYDRLSEIPDAVGITRDHNAHRGKGSFGLWLTTPGLRYEDAFARVGISNADRRAIAFEPDAMSRVVKEMLEETGRCQVMCGTTFTDVKTDGRRLTAIRAKKDDGTAFRITARVFIDSTGGSHLCRAAGYETMLGPDAKSRFGERFAPEEPGTTLNGISLCYRIRKSDNPVRQLPPEPPVKKWPRSTHISGLPCGDLMLNPLPVLQGRDLIEYGYDECLARAKRIVQAQWHWLQQNPTFSEYEFHSFAPMLGIRESYRVVGEYVLTQQDLEMGLQKQRHPDIIAVADHSMDVHGSGNRHVRGALKGPYGIPYRCLIPRGSVNLLVACRGASFSHIAASSCRLSRTIIQLGHAAGLAAAMATEAGVPVGQVDIAALREQLKPEQRCR